MLLNFPPHLEKAKYSVTNKRRTLNIEEFHHWRAAQNRKRQFLVLLEGARRTTVGKWREKQVKQGQIPFSYIQVSSQSIYRFWWRTVAIGKMGNSYSQKRIMFLKPSCSQVRSMKSLFFSLSYITYGLFNFKILLLPGNSSAPTRQTTNLLSSQNPISLKPPEQRRTE